jgi:hypothetical protein
MHADANNLAGGKSYKAADFWPALTHAFGAQFTSPKILGLKHHPLCLGTGNSLKTDEDILINNSVDIQKYRQSQALTVCVK